MWLSDDEIGALARELELSDEHFRSRYTRRFGRGGVVLRQKRNQDCVFWDETRGCTVHALRPRQCRSYPFWRANLVSRDAWQAEAACCPGIGEGERVPADAIASRAADDGIPSHRTRLRVPGRGPQEREEREEREE